VGRIGEQLHAAMRGSGLAAADSLCRACVALLDVDGAAISVVDHGQSRGTFGSSGELSRRLDDYQFTYGEGPCLDAVRLRAPVLVSDLSDPVAERWPAFTASLQDAGVEAVFALPVTIAAATVGALDLFRHRAGPLDDRGLEGALAAARLAASPLLDVEQGLARRAAAGVDVSEPGEVWDELASLERTEVYQATGFLIAQADVTSVEALVRLRARAYSTGQTASEVAWEVLERRLVLDRDGSWRRGDGHGGGDGGTGGTGEREPR